MSLAHIKQIIHNKYDEIYNINNIKYIQNKEEQSIVVEQFIYELLDTYDKHKVMHFIKELFDIEFEIDNINNEEEFKLQESRNDDEFRKAVINKYKQCIICNSGDCHKSSYQVAHIYDFAKCETDLEKYDINNGLLMCSNMHKYFDDLLLQFVINFSENDIYLVKSVFCDSMNECSFYNKYNGKQLNIIFNKENIKYLEKKNNLYNHTTPHHTIPPLINSSQLHHL